MKRVTSSEPVEAPGIRARDLGPHVLGQIAPLAQWPRALRPVAVPVGVVARVHDEVGTEGCSDRRQDRLLGLAAHPHVPRLDVASWVLAPAVPDPVATLLPVLVHAVDEVRYPAHARLE